MQTNSSSGCGPLQDWHVTSTLDPGDQVGTVCALLTCQVVKLVWTNLINSVRACDDKKRGDLHCGRIEIFLRNLPPGAKDTEFPSLDLRIDEVGPATEKEATPPKKRPRKS